MGYDVHRLVPDRELWMGGIKLDYELGLLGHSDADVLIHAICDAILGAANMRDIGYHFPDTSAETEGMDSKVILKKTIELIATKGYHLVNIDATICAERPKMNPHIPEIIPISQRCSSVWLLLSERIPTTFPSRLRPPRNSASRVDRRVYRLMLLP